MVAKRSDYTSEAIEAARSVLLELSRLLGEYQDSVVVVGGWVPELLLNQASRRHVGSIDVDIACYTKPISHLIDSSSKPDVRLWPHPAPRQIGSCHEHRSIDRLISSAVLQS